MARVSVIIPVFNPGPYLRLAVLSVLEQTFTDWELVIVDDGSTVDLSAIRSEFPQAKFIRVANCGVSAARNVGILNTTGEYIAFLDCDDVWKSGKLERQVALMDREPDIALCYTAYEEINSAGVVIGHGHGITPSSYLELLRGPCPLPSLVMIRRSCLSQCGLFDPLVLWGEDYDLFLKIAYRNELRFLPSVELSYRLHDCNKSRDFASTMFGVEVIYEKHLALAKLNRDNEVFEAIKYGRKWYREHIALVGYEQCRSSFRRREFKSLLKHLFKTATFNPIYVMQSLAHWVTLRVVPNRH